MLIGLAGCCYALFIAGCSVKDEAYAPPGKGIDTTTVYTDLIDTTIVTGVVDTNSQHFYLCSYFLNSNDQAGARLALSSDGIVWQLINEGNPIMVPTMGPEHRQRDPYIFYDSTAKLFHFVWTTGWNGTDLGYSESKDLQRWSPQIDLQLGAKIPNCSCVWAPEIFWDDIQNRFMIYWSTDNGTNGKRAWYVLTTDFKTFTDPAKLFDPGYSEIDGDMLKVADGKYYLFFKDERDPGEAGQPTKNIHYVYGPTPQGPWSTVSNTITGPGCEGPSSIKIGNVYRIYFDPYYDFTSTYRMVTVANLDTTASPWPQGAILTTATSNFSYNHCGIIEIPRIYAMHLLNNTPIQ
jgi:hypothetical protein